MIDRILDTVLILLIAYGHIIVFIDTGRMAEKMESRGADLEPRDDGFSPVDRTMFLADTPAVKKGRRVPVIENGMTRYITI